MTKAISVPEPLWAHEAGAHVIARATTERDQRAADLAEAAQTAQVIAANRDSWWAALHEALRAAAAAFTATSGTPAVIFEDMHKVGVRIDEAAAVFVLLAENSVMISQRRAGRSDTRCLDLGADGDHITPPAADLARAELEPFFLAVNPTQ